MNKKFSTLVATLLLSGALFTLNAAAVSDLSKVTGIEVVDKTASTPMTIKFTANATLSSGEYIEITEDNVVVDGQGKTLNGSIVVFGKNVTIKNLKVVYAKGSEGMTNAVTINAEGATVTGCSFELAKSTTEKTWTNGLLIWPVGGKQTITVKDCSFKGFAQSVSGEGGTTWSGAGLLISAQAPTDKGWQKSKLAEGAKSAAYSDLTISMSGNTFEGCAVDYNVTEEQWSDGKWEKSGYIETLITPLYKNGEMQNGGEVEDAIANRLEDAKLTFNGTAEELAEALKDAGSVANVVVNTNDGVITAGLRLPADVIYYNGNQTTGKRLDLVKKAEKDTYYVWVVRTDGDKSNNNVVYWDEKTATVKSSAANTVKEISDEYLWKVESAWNEDGHYDFKFTNKKTQKVLMNGEKAQFCSVNEAGYNQGIALELPAAFAGISGLSTEGKNLYTGLYREITHCISAEDLNALHNKGFYVSFDKTAGTEAFAGLLEAVGEKGATEFVLKNEDGDYIKASAKNVTGKNIKQYVYAFELTEKVAEASTFRFWHTPSDVEDNHLLLTKIDSIQVKVRDDKDDTKSMDWATLGTYLLTTENVNTLGASIETELDPVSIDLTDYTVDPTKFLKKGFAVIKQLNEEGDLYVVATGCGDKKITLSENYASRLEAQWAVTYDKDRKQYTMVNRENTAAKTTVAYFKLRENGDKEDNVYLYGGDEYEIVFDDVDASDVYYQYLSEGTGAEGKADLAERSFVMSYFSTVFDGSANVAINDKNLAYIGTTAEQAEFAAAAVDTIYAESKMSVWNATKKEWETEKSMLKAPVYEFSVGEKKLGLNDAGKLALVKNATPMVVRYAGDHANLAKAVKETASGKKDAKFDGKLYAGNNDSYMYAVSCLYDENKNTLFEVNDNNRPEYRRLGKTVKDGLNDMEGDLNILKFFRTNDENQFLYENSINRNAGNGAACLNFLGETNLNDKPANAQLPFLVDTAYIRNNTRKPLYLLSVRNTLTPAEVDVPCDVPGHGMNCEHATKGHPAYRTGAYLVALDDSVKSGNKGYEQAKYQGNVRLAFVEATHYADTLRIHSSEFTNGTKKEQRRDSIFFSSTDKKTGVVTPLAVNPAAFAFKLVDRTVDAEGDKAAFIIENTSKVNGKDVTRYVRVHNTVPVLVEDIKEAAEFEVMVAGEGETATANEGIEATGVSVVATNGAVIVKGAEGKKVVISNVLGQTIANTVIASSEATIAAPAGVVVVAVEGEAAVKAIVK